MRVREEAEMLTYDLNHRGQSSIYEYLYQCIRQDIQTGVLAAGERLPSKRSLARHLNIGVITVANAYEQLLTEGYIRAEERRGYFVQDISGYSRKADLRAEDYPPEPPEREFFADFKANRIGLQHFPAATWNRFMREALSQPNDSLLKTVPYNGLYELRLAISEYLLRNRGMRVMPSQIVIGAGTEYLYSRLMQMFGRACTFAIEDPGYKKFAAISASFGNPWKYIPIDDSGLMIDKLEESGADVVHVSPSNHFPTGIVMHITRRLELSEWVGRVKKRYIIEDDYDSEFRYSGKFILPMYAEDTQNKVIYMNTFSKSMVPSLRISYMVLPPDLLQRYIDTMSFYSCTVSSFEQYALARFISEGHFERHINHMRNYYRGQRARILSAVKNSPLGEISKIIEQNAGTHFLLNVRTSLSEEEVRRAGLKADLSLSMYSDYSYSDAGTSSCTLVINYAGIPQEKIAEVAARLSSIFPECSGKNGDGSRGGR